MPRRRERSARRRLQRRRAFLRHRGRAGHRQRRRADDQRGQSAARRAGDLEPGHRRGSGRGQCPGRQSGRRRRLCATASSSPTRFATESSRTCFWCSPTAAASPPTRRSAGTATPPSTGRLIRPARCSPRRAVPKNPTWQINAVKVVHDPVKHRIRYEGASLNLLGARIVALPFLSHPDGTEGGGSGLLVPDIRLSSSNGFELSAPYYLKLAPNRDATITPHVYTEVAPMLEGRYRHLTRLGAFQLGAFVTYGSRVPLRFDHRDQGRGRPRLSRGQRPLPAQPAVDASPPPAATSPTAPSCAATTFPATAGCARSSRPSGSPPTAISRSPAGPSRASGSPTSPASSRSPFPRSTRAGACPAGSGAARSRCRRTASPS